MEIQINPPNRQLDEEAFGGFSLSKTIVGRKAFHVERGFWLEVRIGAKRAHEKI